MATKKKNKTNPKLKVEQIDCTYAIGGVCAMQVAACNLLESNLQKMIWKHRENLEEKFYINEIFISQNETGNFIFYVDLSSQEKKHSPVSLFEFLKEFHPTEELEFPNGIN